MTAGHGTLSVVYASLTPAETSSLAWPDLTLPPAEVLLVYENIVTCMIWPHTHAWWGPALVREHHLHDLTSHTHLLRSCSYTRKPSLAWPDLTLTPAEVLLVYENITCMTWPHTHTPAEVLLVYENPFTSMTWPHSHTCWGPGIREHLHFHDLTSHSHLPRSCSCRRTPSLSWPDLTLTSCHGIKHNKYWIKTRNSWRKVDNANSTVKLQDNANR